MGLIDQLALRAAGAVGQYQTGRRAGEQERYKRSTAEQERDDALKREALQQAILQKREERDILNDQENRAWRQAQIAKLNKPEPVEPKSPKIRFETDTTDGTIYAIDEGTLKATPVQGVKKRVQPAGGQSQAGWQFFQTDNGFKRGNPRTGQVEDVDGLTKTPASVQKELGSLRALEADLDAAEQAVKGAPGAFSSGRLAFKGLKDYAPKTGSLIRTLAENNADPLNAQARIIVGGVSNESLHKKYGSALSVNEIARSELDTPNVDGDDAEQVLRKINAMRANVRRRREGLQGHQPPPSSPSPQNTVAPTPAGKRSSLMSDLDSIRGRP